MNADHDVVPIRASSLLAIRLFVRTPLVIHAILAQAIQQEPTLIDLIVQRFAREVSAIDGAYAGTKPASDLGRLPFSRRYRLLEILIAFCLMTRRFAFSTRKNGERIRPWSIIAVCDIATIWDKQRLCETRTAIVSSGHWRDGIRIPAGALYRDAFRWANVPRRGLNYQIQPPSLS